MSGDQDRGAQPNRDARAFGREPDRMADDDVPPWPRRPQEPEEEPGEEAEQDSEDEADEDMPEDDGAPWPSDDSDV